MKKSNQFLICTVGAFLFTFAINVIVVPVGLYNGGFVGISQLIRTFIEMFTDYDTSKFDISGLIYFLLNVPLLILAYKEMSRSFLVKTAYTVGLQTILFSIIPIPSEPIVPDPLTSCLIGGIIAGVGAGLVLRAGSSGGGQDILGVYFAKKYHNFSVGKLSIIINAVIYFICALMFEIDVVVYSIIYTVISSIVIDKVHTQNQSSTVMIFSKDDTLANRLMTEIDRGVTVLRGKGTYTNEDVNVIIIVASKYEISAIKKVIEKYEPSAFTVVNNGNQVIGNFQKRLDF